MSDREPEKDGTCFNGLNDFTLPLNLRNGTTMKKCEFWKGTN